MRDNVKAEIRQRNIPSRNFVQPDAGISAGDEPSRRFMHPRRCEPNAEWKGDHLSLAMNRSMIFLKYPASVTSASPTKYLGPQRFPSDDQAAGDWLLSV